MESSQTPTTSGERIGIQQADADTMVDVSRQDNECGTVDDEKSPSPAVSANCSGKSAADIKEEDAFYQKLNKINESSGLSLLFNFRDANINLHEFYKFVTDRGGYLQVTKDENWEAVAFRSTWKNKIKLKPTQVQKIYATILYPFEQTYYYRSPVKHHNSPVMLDTRLVHDSIKKRKHNDGIYAPECDGESPSKKIEYDYDSRKSSQEEKTVLETVAKVKRKDSRAPVRSRNSYHMYLKMECERLKTIHGDTPSAELRDEVIEAWRQLSNDAKKPYIEASKKDRERYMKEMAAYEENMRKELTAHEELKSKQQNQFDTTTIKHVKFSSPTPSQEPARGSHMTPLHEAETQKVVDVAVPQSVQTDSEKTA
ncbi:hypothetical protein L2E82_49652 [Cichorium intybus]|uniref:Uncharacterized protein n=1 Tax=Cichorium intybus TaxID=13427 RepID=A0ACB8Z0W0_CICIN|nr:hypothetical protein L2E82_49652 [Cichorium intybus]